MDDSSVTKDVQGGKQPSPDTKARTMLDKRTEIARILNPRISPYQDALLKADELLHRLKVLGYVVMPIEATEEMLAAAGEAFMTAAVAHHPGDLGAVNRPFARWYRAMVHVASHA